MHQIIKLLGYHLINQLCIDGLERQENILWKKLILYKLKEWKNNTIKCN